MCWLLINNKKNERIFTQQKKERRRKLLQARKRKKISQKSVKKHTLQLTFGTQTFLLCILFFLFLYLYLHLMFDRPLFGFSWLLLLLILLQAIRYMYYIVTNLHMRMKKLYDYLIRRIIFVGSCTLFFGDVEIWFDGFFFNYITAT